MAFAEGGDKLVEGHGALLAAAHVLELNAAGGHLVFADKGHEGDRVCVGIAKLLFHLRRVGVKLSTNAGSAHAGNQRQEVVGLTLAEVHKEQLGGSQRIFGLEIKLVQDIVNAICAE